MHSLTHCLLYGSSAKCTHIAQNSSIRLQSPACGPCKALVSTSALSSRWIADEICFPRWKEWFGSFCEVTSVYWIWPLGVKMRWRTATPQSKKDSPECKNSSIKSLHALSCEWWELHHLDPVHCYIPKELAFLQGQLDSSKPLSVLTTHVVISGHISLWAHKPVHSLSEGSKALLSVTHLPRAQSGI